MQSVIDLTPGDESYIDYMANVKTRWGSTFLRARDIDEFVIALAAVLPRDSDVIVRFGKINQMDIAYMLKQRDYKVYVRK